MAQLNFREQKNIDLPEPIQKLTLANESPGGLVFAAEIEGGVLIVRFRDFLPSPTAPASPAASKKIVLAE